jgi:hypothetical protein
LRLERSEHQLWLLWKCERRILREISASGEIHAARRATSQMRVELRPLGVAERARFQLVDQLFGM